MTLVFANGKDLHDLVDGEREHAQLTRPFEDLMDRKMPLAHDVAAQLQVTKRVVALEADLEKAEHSITILCR